MYLKEELRKSHSRLSDLLLWESLAGSDVLELSDGSLQSTWEYNGIDLESLSPVERRQLASQLARMLNLGERWLVETNAMRREVREYLPTPHWAHPVAQTIDYERFGQFTQPGIFYRTARYLTLTHYPEAGAAQRQLFSARVAQFEAELSNFVSCKRLGVEAEDNRMLRYLRECVYGEDYPFPNPTLPIHVYRLFRRKLTTGTHPALGEKHVRTLVVDSFPHGSWPGMFRALENLQFPYRWHTRMMLMDPPTSTRLHDKNFRMWRGSEKGIVSQFFNWNTKVSGDAVEMKNNADQASTLAQRGQYLFGMWNAKMILMSESLEELAQWRVDIEKAIKPLGFGLRLEDINATDAWRGSLPGHAGSDARVYPVTTENLADGMPLSMPFAGFRENPSPHMPPQTPALFLAATDGNTPYYFNQHVGQVQQTQGKREAEILHSTLLGPTRAGKSFKLGFTVLSWLTRYENAQVFAFDKKFSMRNLVWALDGSYYPFGGNQEQLHLAPLREVDTEEDLAAAANWLESLCMMRGLILTPGDANDLNIGLRKLSARPNSRRSLTEFLVQLRNERLIDALQYYTGASAASGGLLDGQEDSLGNERFCCFEMEYLMQMDKRILRAVLTYLFRCIMRRLDSRKPTLIPFDEAWTALDDEHFSGLLSSWLRELAKFNAGVILCTQNTGDIIGKPLEQIVLNQCATREYLPAPAANRAAKDDYLKFGLNSQQIERIASGTAKRDYFIQAPNGFQQIQLYPGEVLKAFLGRNGSQDRSRITYLRETYPKDWQVAWLRECQLEDWAAHLEQLFEEKRSKEEWQESLSSI